MSIGWHRPRIRTWDACRCFHVYCYARLPITLTQHPGAGAREPWSRQLQCIRYIDTLERVSLLPRVIRELHTASWAGRGTPGCSLSCNPGTACSNSYHMHAPIPAHTASSPASPFLLYGILPLFSHLVQMNQRDLNQPGPGTVFHSLLIACVRVSSNASLRSCTANILSLLACSAFPQKAH